MGVDLAAYLSAARVVKHVQHWKAFGSFPEPPVRRRVELPQLADIEPLPAPRVARAQFVIITCTRIQLIRIFQTPRLSNTVYPIEYGHVRHVTQIQGRIHQGPETTLRGRKPRPEVSHHRRGHGNDWLYPQVRDQPPQRENRVPRAKRTREDL